MSRLYDTVEPAVIDEDMLNAAIEEQGQKGEAGRIAKEEGVDYNDVKSLRLDFKNILPIDNLWPFVNLVRLQLDNNIIEKIEGLDALVNLVWLDLSFNNIQQIDGLSKLTKLEDLSLFNNRISVIEKLESQTALQVFSIGNNNIGEIENLLYLRKFKHLRTVNISGNPVCEIPDYKMYVAAHVPQLTYLDYRLLDDQFKQVSREKFTTSVEEMVNDEKAAARKADVENARELELQKHRLAFVEYLNGPQLFQSLFAEDNEGQKLNAMPGVAELLSQFQEKFTLICVQIFELGLVEHDKRQNEVNEFWASVNDVKAENDRLGKNAINEFNAHKEKVFEELQVETDPKLFETRVEVYRDEINKLWDALMGYELQLVDQLDEAIKDFERNVQDLTSSFVENVQALTSQLRDLENQHNEKLLEVGMVTLEKALKNELDADIPESLRDLLVDKDTVVNAIQSSHDYHLLKIDNREDDIVTRVRSWEKNLIEGLHEEEEIQRNRKRVLEVVNLIDHYRDEVQVMEYSGDVGGVD